MSPAFIGKAQIRVRWRPSPASPARRLASLRSLAQEAGRSQPDIRGLGMNFDRVFCVERENIAHQNSAARSERQPFDMIALRQIGRNTIGDRGRRCAGIAHRQSGSVWWLRRRSVPAARARWPVHPRCCRTLRSNRPPEAAWLGSISRSSRSRIELAYSVRFRRCRPVVPGFGLSRRGTIERQPPIWLQKSSSVARSGPRHPARRHHPGANFSHHFFPQLPHCCRDARDPICRSQGRRCESFRCGTRRNSDPAARDPARSASARNPPAMSETALMGELLSRPLAFESAPSC